MRTFTAVVVAALAVGIHAEEGLDAALAEVERLKNQAERTRRNPESTISVDGGDVSLTVEDGKHIAIDVGGVVTNLDQLDANMKALDAEGLTASTAAILLGYKLGVDANDTRAMLKAEEFDALQADIETIATSVKVQQENIQDNLKTSMDDIKATIISMKAVISSAGPPQCIPGLEYQVAAATDTAPATCAYLTECSPGFYEASVPTRTTDRMCKQHTECGSDEFKETPGNLWNDAVCKKLTVCKSSESEKEPATATSDRLCVGGSVSACTDIGTGPVEGGGYCVAKKDVGGDGSSKANAGKSCFTIRHGWGKTEHGTYWVYFAEAKSAAWQVYCDMSSCSRDSAGEWEGKDKSGCGGWTLALKSPGASSNSNCLNKKDARWRNGAEFGDTKTSNAVCSKGPAFKKASFTDVLMRSLNNPEMNVAWRHTAPGANMHAIISTCTRKHDGAIIVPGYIQATYNQQLTSLLYIDWWDQGASRSHQGDRALPAGGYHSACTGEQRWGFFMQDYNGGTAIAGCGGINNNGGGGVIGMANYNWNRAYTYEMYGVTTNCISAFAFGGGYGCACEGGTTSYQSHAAMQGHWWGHGGSHMHANAHGMFVRDIRDIPGVAVNKAHEAAAYNDRGGGHVCKGCRDAI